MALIQQQPPFLPSQQDHASSTEIATLRVAVPEERVLGIVRDAVQLHQQGELAAALQLYDTALRLDPDQFDALNNRGVALRALGRPDAAVESLFHATRIAPGRSEGFYNLANALVQTARDDEACSAFEMARTLDPVSPSIWRNLAAVYARLGRRDDEIAAYRQLVALDPPNAEWWNNLGAALFARGKVEAARACTARAVALRPGFALALKNHGVVLAHLGAYVEAAAVLGQAVAAGGDDAATLAALGQALVQASDAVGAAACFERAIAVDPTNLDAQLGLARSAFLRGDMASAWAAYSSRWRIAGNTYPEHLDRPEWRGEPVVGKTILVWAEQGVGDTLQFVRYAPLLQARGARVILLVQPQVASVVETLPGVAQVLPAGAPRPHYDYHVPLLNLPPLLGGGLEQIPDPDGYLAVPPGVGLPSLPMLDTDQFKVGIVWAGNPSHKNDRNRSVALASFLRLCEIPRTAWFSLQVGASRDQLKSSGADALIHDLAPALASYAETAAVLTRLDLVISVDTSVVHLAGALGRPVWCLLPFAPDWRWQLWRGTSPWYRSMRMFRQPQPGAWDEAFMAIGRELRDHVAATG